MTQAKRTSFFVYTSRACRIYSQRKNTKPTTSARIGNRIMSAVHVYIYIYFHLTMFLTWNYIGAHKKGPRVFALMRSGKTLLADCLYLYIYKSWCSAHPLPEVGWFFWKKHFLRNALHGKGLLRYTVDSCLNAFYSLRNLFQNNSRASLYLNACSFKWSTAESDIKCITDELKRAHELIEKVRNQQAKTSRLCR